MSNIESHGELVRRDGDVLWGDLGVLLHFVQRVPSNAQESFLMKNGEKSFVPGTRVVVLFSNCFDPKFLLPFLRTSSLR